MASDSVPNGPAPSPDLPISVHLDGNIGAVDFIRRLHAGGLQLRQGSDDDYAVITLADGEEPALTAHVQHERIEQQRRQLNKAVAVLIGAELTAEHSPEMSLVTDAVAVARELVESAIAALDSVNLPTANRSNPMSDTTETPAVVDAATTEESAGELPKLPGDRVADARSLLWEAEALCHVGRAAYQDEDLDIYNTFGAIVRLLEGAQEELDELPKRIEP